MTHTVRRALMAPVLVLGALLSPLVAAPSASAQNLEALDRLGHVIGVASAPVEVVEFVDFGCSQCARFTSETFEPLYREFILTGKVRWRTVPFVLGSFPHAALAAEAGECAAEQGRFLAMHDALLSNQQEWKASRAPQPVFARLARDAGVDPAGYADCLKTERTRDRVREHKAMALALKVYGTPTFLVQRQRRILGAIPGEQFAAQLRMEVAQARR